ncbi:hypothetical protein AGDE_13812 [Angomonas deanei]|uniref:Uncharacterized protein n=1 Tax=Angomonas deanei TaxID=59799 RepID=A0A7G2CL27_9TRYP|nr:hypothetical protein AGDE_13812 [Angomonas deanei]CAD2220560.1 hypothetical protein, conserved [Angomonas deanei]|eukprot:EPY21701.1 hypothetical protein AGDE_13812 [Angomonas deanei]
MKKDEKENVFNTAANETKKKKKVPHKDCFIFSASAFATATAFSTSAVGRPDWANSALPPPLPTDALIHATALSFLSTIAFGSRESAKVLVSSLPKRSTPTG